MATGRQGRDTHPAIPTLVPGRRIAYPAGREGAGIPLASLPPWLAVEWGRRATFGGVRRIEPGDVVVGDLDGVAVVPQTLASVRKGMAPLQAYEQFGVF